jgi:hypothetical protein
MSRRWSFKKNNNKIIYNILNINENTKDKDCITADTNNEKKYQSVMKKAGETSKLWDNTGVTMNIDVPVPQKPNNYDRLLDFRKKNVLRPSIQQSNATIYLYKNGYVLGKDYEAYQAIEIHSKLIQKEVEEKHITELIEESSIQKPNNIKDLSLIDKVPQSKNLYPNLEVSHKKGNVKKINIYKKNKINLPKVNSYAPIPSAPNSYENSVYKEGYKTFNHLENRYNSSSSNDSYNFEC